MTQCPCHVHNGDQRIIVQVNGRENMDNEEQKLQSDLSDDYVAELWEKYYGRLKNSISDRVKRIRRPVASDSEIALSAFNSLVKGVKEGKFPELENESEMWRLLKTIAIRKANDTHKHLWASKRGGKVGALGQADTENSERAGAIDGAPAQQGQGSELEVEEMLSNLLERLPNDKYRDVVVLKLQGLNTLGIAEHLGTTTRTVQRMLNSVRSEWEDELEAG